MSREKIVSILLSGAKNLVEGTIKNGKNELASCQLAEQKFAEAFRKTAKSLESKLEGDLTTSIEVAEKGFAREHWKNFITNKNPVQDPSSKNGSVRE